MLRIYFYSVKVNCNVAEYFTAEINAEECQSPDCNLAHACVSRMRTDDSRQDGAEQRSEPVEDMQPAVTKAAPSSRWTSTKLR